MELDLSGIPGWLYLLLAAATLIQLFYYIGFYRRLFSYKREVPAQGVLRPVSVIIAARNEAGNLAQFLPGILGQDYPEFEVVVVNDCSYDGTAEVLQELKRRYDRLKIVEVTESEKYRHGKKFALTMGIKAAANEVLLFTDADCRPLSGEWIRRMQEQYGEDTEIVLGVSPYEKKPGLLNAFIRYETFYTALNYISFALAGKPYMGVGRNLSYKKSLFFRQKGFASHLHLKSGDDDLFVNQAATPANTRVEISREAMAVSRPKETWSDYFRQKGRHQSVGKYYRAGHRFHLTLIAVSAIVFYGCLAVLPVLGVDLRLLGATAGLKWLVQYIVFRPAMKKLDAGGLWLLTPLFDLFYHIYLIFINLIPVSPEKVQWK